MPKTNTVFPHVAKRTRSGLLNRSLIIAAAVVAVLGLSIGYVSSPTSSDVPDNPTPESPSPASPGLVHSFPLSDADVSDSIEAPAVAITESGLIALAWATEAKPNEQQVLMAVSSDGGVTFESPRSVVTTGVHTSISEMRGKKIARRLKTLPRLAAVGDTLYLSWVEWLTCFLNRNSSRCPLTCFICRPGLRRTQPEGMTFSRDTWPKQQQREHR